MSQRIEANTLLGDRYRLVEPVADRGMGEAWRVVDERRSGAALIVKLLRAIEGDELPPEALSAVRALKALRHASVPTTLAHGVCAGRPWVALDDVQGDSLGALLDRARATGELVDLALLRRLFDAVAGALAAAHASALAVHAGVITPGSVIALAKPTPRSPCALLDLGLSPWLDAPRGVSAKSARVLVAVAPERLAGAPATVATDVFALGALLTEMLARPADEGATLAAVTDARRRADVPDGVWRALSVAMAAAPASRFATVTALVTALDAAWREAPTPARSRLEALVDAAAAKPSGSLLDTVAPVANGPSLTPGAGTPRGVVEVAPAAPLGPLPPLAALLSTAEPTRPTPPPAVTKSAGGSLAALLNAMPAESNPWATEVRQREVAMPGALNPRAREGVDPDEGATLVARTPNTHPDDEGATLIAAVPAPRSSPKSLFDAALAAHALPMNVPDGTLVAAVPTQGLRAPVNAPTPVVAPSPPAPAAQSSKPLVAIVVALVALAAVAAVWLLSRGA